MHKYDMDLMLGTPSRKVNGLLRKRAQDYMDGRYRRNLVGDRSSQAHAGAAVPHKQPRHALGLPHERGSLITGRIVRKHGEVTRDNRKVVVSHVRTFLRDVVRAGNQASLPKKDSALCTRDAIADRYARGNRTQSLLREMRLMVKVVKGKGSAR